IDAAANALPPIAIVEIPLHGLAQSGFHRLARTPAELAADLAGIDRVTQVVARPIGNELNQALALADFGIGRQLVDQRADRLHDRKIGPLIIPANIVALAEL